MSQLVRLLGRRLIALPMMILGVTLLVFVIMSFSPSDPARLALGESASPEALEMYREANGLNDPVGCATSPSSPAWSVATSAPPAETCR